jgi:hypothetical protein
MIFLFENPYRSRRGRSLHEGLGFKLMRLEIECARADQAYGM